MNQDSLTNLIQQYQAHHQPGFLQLLNFYQQLPTLEKAIEYAGLAKRPDDKRHPHQRRLEKVVLNEVYQNILDNKEQLEKSSSFEEIMELVRQCRVHGYGELTIYDTALHLATYLNLKPTRVYLHAGTRKGAAALGLDSKQETLEVAALPKPLQALDPCDIENFLCIYKDRFSPDMPEDLPPPKGCNPTTIDPTPPPSCYPTPNGPKSPRSCS